MKKVLTLLSAILLLVVSGSCSNDDDYNGYPIEYAAAFTMVNAYEGNNQVRYIVDNRSIQTPYQPLIYRTFGYANLWSGNRALTIIDNANPKPLVNEVIQVESGKAYTSFIAGTSSEMVNHFITSDEGMPQEEGVENPNAGVRFFNLSSDNVEVSVQFDGKVAADVFANRIQDSKLTASKSQIFNGVEPNAYKVSIVDKSGNVLATRENVKFEKGKYYTLTFVGAKDNKEKSYYIGVI
ncbi:MULTISPECIES: DUF4397 domain-containing protein [unclassified Myroides]|uniref:DUF4397 domain-containing protein n=1 Tax=unclassified Myroides TaxID=2642485 RepID=UPI00310149F3